MAEQLPLPGLLSETGRDFSLELVLTCLPESARPIYLEAYRRSARLRGLAAAQAGPPERRLNESAHRYLGISRPGLTREGRPAVARPRPAGQPPALTLTLCERGAPPCPTRACPTCPSV